MTPRAGATDTMGRLYTAAVVAAAAMLLAVRLTGPGLDRPLAFGALLAASILLATSKVRLPLAGGQATLSMSYVTDFLALLALGPLEAMLVAGTGAAAQCVFLSRTRPTWHRTVFSAAALVVTIEVTWQTVGALGGLPPGATWLHVGMVTLGAAAAFFVTNSWLVATAVAAARRASVATTWHDEFLWTAPACLVGAASAALVVRAENAYLWGALLAAAPLYITLKAYRLYSGRLDEQQRHVKEVSDLHLASVEALARAIDARAQTIGQAGGNDSHVRRVQAWATALAQAAGMSATDVEAIRVAALLHDIGKLAVPEHILSKPGRLTPKEFSRMRIHPIVGAEIIKAVPFPYPVASFIRCHHERWDGSGYPDGLRGEETPLGARVLAVADYFDAVSTSRPYHAATTRAAAAAALQADAGSALDPSLVSLFLSILPATEREDLDGTIELTAELTSSRAAPLVGFADDPAKYAPTSAFDQIARASQEMRALHDIAQTLGTRLSVDDTMALLTSKLNRLVPGSCWVLFLHDEVEDVLRARFATGLAAETLGGMTIPGGSGSSGWVARHRLPLLNARAAADFEAAGLTVAGPPVQAALSYPLLDGDHLIGVLTVYHVETNPFSDEHQHVLDQISSQAASVLKNAVAFERLRDVSLTDPLTDLPNTRALTAFLDEVLAAGAGRTTPTTIVVIDVDDFKTVNDVYGHPGGDAALRAVAATIREHVRHGEFCARYGGDEFVMVLSGCARDEAEQRAAELQEVVAAQNVTVDWHPGQALRIRISVGVGQFPADGTTIPALIAAADRRMYVDKAERRAGSRAPSLRLIASRS